MKHITKTNTYLVQLANDLYKVSAENKVAIWKRVAEDLLKPTRHKRLVNVFALEMNTNDGDVIVVPGKVLGTGDMTRKLTVAACSFSKSAVEKIKQAKGNVMTINELMQKNPKGKDVRIFG